jgi:hypothetical protein
MAAPPAAAAQPAPVAQVPKLSRLVQDDQFIKLDEKIVNLGAFYAQSIVSKFQAWHKDRPDLTDDDLKSRCLAALEKERGEANGITPQDLTAIVTLLSVLRKHDVISESEQESERSKWKKIYDEGGQSGGGLTKELLKQDHQRYWDNLAKDYPPLTDKKGLEELDRSIAHGVNNSRVTPLEAAIVLGLLEPDAGKRARFAQLILDFDGEMPFGYLAFINFQNGAEHESMRRRLAPHVPKLEVPLFPDREAFRAINAEIMRCLEHSDGVPVGGGERRTASKIKFFAKATRAARRKQAPFLLELPGEGPAGGEPISYVVPMQQDEIGTYSLDLSRVATALGGLWDGMLEMRSFLQVVAETTNEQVGKLLAKVSARAQTVAPPKQQQQQRSRKQDNAPRSDGGFTGRASQPGPQRAASRSRSAERPPNRGGRGGGRGQGF